MWAHHADLFSGMWVQYNVNPLLRRLDDTIAIIRMIYSEHEPIWALERSTPTEKARDCLSSEMVRWANERDWRIFRVEGGQASYSRAAAARKILLKSRAGPAERQKLVEASRVNGCRLLERALAPLDDRLWVLPATAGLVARAASRDAGLMRAIRFLTSAPGAWLMA